MGDPFGWPSTGQSSLDVDSFPSVQALRRSDGQLWDSVLEPLLRDCVWVQSDTRLNTRQIERGVSLLLEELVRYPLPQFLLSTGPANACSVTPLSFASALVGHRAERLVQTVELTSAALLGLECGALQLSAVASRALFELAIVCSDIHQQLLEPWRSVHGNIKRVRQEANSDESVTFQVLWEARMGTRTYDLSQGWPQATRIGKRIARFSRSVTSAQDTYNLLCEATHPNVEAQAALWRNESRLVGGHQAIRFAPGASNSPIKLAIGDAVFISLGTVVPFVRDLWWVAADIMNTCDITPNDQTRLLGVPARTARDAPCSCGSGLRTRECSHNEPQFDPEVELA